MNTGSSEQTGDGTGFRLQRIPVSIADLAEDAGHMGMSRSYHPGSQSWKKRHDNSQEIEDLFEAASRDN